jgi:NTE family protein
MLAFAERDVEFEVISATGVGGLIGMLYLAPRGGDRKKALRELSNLFVSDWLYRLFPVNFKVFHKFSPFANAFYEFRKSLPKFHVAPEERSEVKRLVNDWLELWATAITPRGLESRHNGLMSHIPLIEDLVDFDKLKTSATRFHLNAFSLRTLKMRFFDNQTMNREAYNAAQAMFVLFPPCIPPTISSPPAPPAIRRGCRPSGCSSATSWIGWWLSTRSAGATGASRPTPMTPSSSCS